MSDLRGVSPPHLDVLALPVGTLLRSLRGEGEESKHPFFRGAAAERRAALRRAAGAPSAARASTAHAPTLLACLPTTPLCEAVEMMVANNVHRIYTVDRATNEPVGVVTLTDVLRLMLLPEPLAGGATA